MLTPSTMITTAAVTTMVTIVLVTISAMCLHACHHVTAADCSSGRQSRRTDRSADQGLAPAKS